MTPMISSPRNCRISLAVVHSDEIAPTATNSKHRPHYEVDERPFPGISCVLDQVERRPAIGEQPEEFTIEVGVPHRQPRNGLGRRGLLVGPVIAPAGQDLHLAGIEPGVHAVPVELDLAEPIGPLGGLLDERGELRFDPGR
jgi:hypothetical protein